MLRAFHFLRDARIAPRKLFRAYICLLAVIFSICVVTPPLSALTPGQKIALFGGGVPQLIVFDDFTADNSVLNPANFTYAGASLRTITDATGAITYAPNNLLLHSATLSTQNVTTTPINYIVSFTGSGSIALSGTATGTVSSSPGFLKISPTAGTLTLTVSGTVTNAVMAAVTYETAPRPGDQVITTSAAYWGPAFDYSPTSIGTPLGLRVEEGRTNLFLNSGAPVTQTITVASGSAYTISFYGTGVLTLSGALTQVMTGSSAYPARTTYAATTSTTSLVVTVTTLGTLEFPQVELGAFATSYIPTAAASVARAPDQVSMTGPALATMEGGSGAAIIETGLFNQTSSPTFIGMASGIQLLFTTGTIRTINAAGRNLSGPTVTPTFGTAISRSGVTWSPQGRSITVNGAVPASDTNPFGPVTSPVSIGIRSTAANAIDGYIRNLALYNRRMSIAALASRTVSPTCSNALDFSNACNSQYINIVGL